MFINDLKLGFFLPKKVNFCIQSTVNVLDKAKMVSINNEFCMVIDLEVIMTIILYLLRKRLQSICSG
jgi:hypothetical protein